MGRRSKKRLSYVSRNAYKNRKGYKDKKILDYNNQYKRFTGKGSIYGYAANKCIYCKETLEQIDTLSNVFMHVECQAKATSDTAPLKPKKKFIKLCKKCNEPIEHTYLGFDTYVRDLCSHCHIEKTVTDTPAEDLRIPDFISKPYKKHIHKNKYCCKINLN